MPFPQDRVELNIAGYIFRANARCRGCHASIEWWITPKGRMMPFTADEPSKAMTPHHAVCPAADQFKRKKAS